MWDRTDRLAQVLIGRMATRYKGPLYQELMKIRPQMAQEAQKVYNLWYQDETGFDEMYGGGGICHDIANAIVEVIYKNIPDATAGSVNLSCAENHVLTMVYLDEEGYVVDIPYHVYETGGGYSWTKIPDVEFSPEDITFSFVHPDDVRGNLEND
jgi:hypothetical protein